jgi:hypothetical protein
MELLQIISLIYPLILFAISMYFIVTKYNNNASFYETFQPIYEKLLPISERLSINPNSKTLEVKGNFTVNGRFTVYADKAHELNTVLPAEPRYNMPVTAASSTIIEGSNIILGRHRGIPESGQGIGRISGNIYDKFNIEGFPVGNPL